MPADPLSTKVKGISEMMFQSVGTTRSAFHDRFTYEQARTGDSHSYIPQPTCCELKQPQL